MVPNFAILKNSNLCKAKGIKQSFTTVNNPQQKRMVERCNRTIETIARSLLISSDLNVRFWTFAIRCAVFIKNRLPHSGINNQIP